MSSLPPSSEQRNVLVLACLQALLLANNSTAIALNALVGHTLASDKSLATVPVTSWVLGAAVSTYFASLLMKRVGRRKGFLIGGGFGVAGALECSAALAVGSFWLFVLGASVFGVYNAFGAYYRFAAADAVPGGKKARAISYVLAGGLVGGIVGPSVSRVTVGALSTQYLGAYLALLVFLGLAFVALTFLELPPPSLVETRDQGRSLGAMALTPVFVVAVLSASIGFGVMSLLMTATPLAMGACGHAYGSAATVITSHVVGMYAPSFFTGDLIGRFGALRVMLSGVLLNLACIAVGLSGVQVSHFWWSLVLLGVGWNFLYIGGTTLLTEAYRPAEKARAQGLNDAIVSLVTGVSAFASGLILRKGGWQTLNYAAIPCMLVVGAAIVWLGLSRKTAEPERA
jgi:MFS family permease